MQTSINGLTNKWLLMKTAGNHFFVTTADSSQLSQIIWDMQLGLKLF